MNYLKNTLLMFSAAIALCTLTSCTSGSQIIKESSKTYKPLDPDAPIKVLFGANAPVVPITAEHIATVQTSKDEYCSPEAISEFLDKRAHELGANLIFVKRVTNIESVEYYVSVVRTVHCQEYLVDFMYDVGGSNENN